MFYAYFLLCFLGVKDKFNKAQNTFHLTLNLLTTTIVAPPSNASKWQIGFNLAFKGLMHNYKASPNFSHKFKKKKVIYLGKYSMWRDTQTEECI